MRYLLLSCLILVLSGCYLANGPPDETKLWIKNGKKIPINEQMACYKKVETLYLTKEERDSLDKLGDEFMKEPFKLMDNKEKYDKYNSLVDKVSVLSSKCFYDLGYRFNAPFYWCLIGNMHICKENIKYSGYGLNYIFPSSPSPQENTDSQ